MKLLSAIAALAIAAVAQAQITDKHPAYPDSVNCATGVTDQNVTAFTLTPGDYCVGKTYTVTTTGPLALDIISGATFALKG
ncbi:hypothetical protein BGZ82_003285, partial [Podila clonocystis]